MKDPKAIYYGKIELIPGIICDGYVLDDGTAVMSERGIADLLGMKQASFQNVTVNSVKVTAENSPHKGRKITVS
ncbi:hypothetical protein QUF50_09475 [Thiotrichales bacterium HSG1]|nr:hypothetical protein [Thiotrichales bacterium HSG1]